MQKHFRKHQKWWLGILGSVLMVLFLIPTGAGFLRADPLKAKLGTLNATNQTLRQRDYNRAHQTLDLMRRLVATTPLLARFNMPAIDPVLYGVGLQEDERVTRWMLMLAEAEANHSEASSYDLMQARALLGIGTEQDLVKIAAAWGYNAETINSLLLDYLRVAGWYDIATGVAYSTPEDATIKAGFGVQRLYRMLKNEGALYALLTGGADYNPSRESIPSLNHALMDMHGTASLRLITFDARSETQLKFADEPNDELRNKLYTQWKNTPQGQGDHGFGYQIPPRVFVEALRIPATSFTNNVANQISQADIRAYFDSQPQPPVAEGETPPSLTPARRAEIQKILVQQRLAKTALEATSKSMTLFARDQITAGDSDLSEDIEFTPMTKVQAWLKQNHQVDAELIEARADLLDNNVIISHKQLQNLHTAVEPNLPLQMLLATLGGSEQTQRVPLHLTPHLRLPLVLLQNSAGDTFIVRALRIESAREPTSINEVKELVDADAKSLLSWQNLCSRSGNLCDITRASGLESIAQKPEDIEIVPEVSRSNPRFRSVSNPKQLTETIFTTIDELVKTKGSIVATSKEKRVLGIPLKEQLSLAVVVIDAYQPIRQSQMRELSSDISTLSQVNLLQISKQDPASDSFTLDALEKRLGWQPVIGATSSAKDEDNSAEPEDLDTQPQDDK